jgi:hypothetical protein
MQAININFDNVYIFLNYKLMLQYSGSSVTIVTLYNNNIVLTQSCIYRLKLIVYNYIYYTGPLNVSNKL